MKSFPLPFEKKFPPLLSFPLKFDEKFPPSGMPAYYDECNSLSSAFV
jgi:hypothetical protein